MSAAPAFRRRDEVAGRIEKALRDVGLWDEVKGRLDAPAPSLSGGQQQRLCIARALVLELEVILLDEPCSALDPLSSGVVEDLIASLAGRYTVLIVTHNLPLARSRPTIAVVRDRPLRSRFDPRFCHSRGAVQYGF